MAYMKRNVNLGLLIVIVASLIMFIAFTIYFETQFKQKNSNIELKIKELEQVTNELGLKKRALNETSELKTKAETDRKALDAKYKDISDENLGLHQDNTNLRLELSQTKSDLAGKIDELEQNKVILAQTQQQLATANSEIVSKNARISDLKDDKDAVCAAYTTLNLGNAHPKC